MTTTNGGTAPLLKPDREAVEHFLAAMFAYADDNTFIAMRAFDDTKKDERPIFIESVEVRSPQVLARACTRISHAALSPSPAVFCPPVATFKSPNGATLENLANGVALSVECDAYPKRSLAILSALLGEPTLVVASGGQWTNADTGEIEEKLHLHWRLKEPTREPSEHIRLREARALACAAVGADPTTISIVHPIRWPGSWHRKREPRLARIVSATENEIDLEDALEKLRATMPPQEPRERPRAAGSTFGFDNNLTTDILDITAALAAIPNADLHWDDWNKIGMATWLASLGGGFAAFDAWSRKSSKYDPQATASRWERYGRSPPTRIGAGTLFHLAAEASPGWRKPSSFKTDRGAGTGSGANPGSDPNAEAAANQDFGPSAQRNGKERTVLQHGGLLVPIERDRLQIVQRLAASPAFPMDKLPPLLRDAVAALEEHVQAPQSLCAHSVLSAAALCTQGLANVEVASLPTPRPLSLFMLAVAASGERKSACDDLALHAVKQIEEERREDYLDEMRRYKARKAAYDAERKKIEGAKDLSQTEREKQLLALNEPAEPLVPYMRAKEPNLEGLIHFLGRSRASVGVFTSEGGQFLGGHGMSDEAKTRTITGLTELWDSGSAQRMRAKELTSISGRRVSISLAAQPKVASSLLGDELARDQGFVGRFLITMPDSKIGTREIRASRALDDPRLQAFHRRCRVLLDLDLPIKTGTQNELLPPSVGLEDTAWAVWRGIAQAIENQCAPEGIWYPVRSAALKMSENIARIAGVLEVFENPDACQDDHRRAAISGETMAVAVDIGAFYLKEAARLCGHAIIDPETRAQDELATWLMTKWEHALVSPRLIQQFAPAHLRTGASLMRARLTALCAAGVLQLNGRGTIDDKTFRETYSIIREEAVAA